MKNKLSASIVAGGVILAGLITGIATMASAQSSATATNTPAIGTSSGNSATAAADKPESPNDPADTDTGTSAHGHAPLGGDGVVSSINGNIIVIGEEADEGGASYTIDASKATVTNNGATASLSDIKAGDKIFVEGSVNGANVSATSISLGHPNHGGQKDENDSDGSAASETAEGTSASGASDQ